MAAQTVDVSTLIDQRKVGGYQWFIIIVCAFVVFLDGFDAQAIGYVAPSLIKAWGFKPAELGPVFSIGLVGLMLGALFIAPLADRIGRRPLIALSTLAFGIFTLATAWATNIEQLMVLRFLTGVGLGGCMPNGIAITSEFSPARSRAFLVMLMFNGFTLGSAAGGLISAELIPHFGWQSVFIAGGVLPLILTPIAWFLLPESLRFQVLNKAPAERVARVVKRLAPDLQVDADTVFQVEEVHTKRMSVRALLSDGRARRTILLWIVFFMSLLDVYLLVNWLPTTMTQVGAPAQTAIYIGIVLQLGAFIGSPGLGWVLDRFGPRGSMFPAYALAAVCIALIGVFATQSIPLTFLVVFLAGFGVIGGQTAANAVAAISYPTEIRSTGVGWCLGVGRVGSIVGPALAGVLLSMNVSTQNIFFLAAIPAAIGAIAAFGLGGRSERPASEAVALAH